MGQVLGGRSDVFALTGGATIEHDDLFGPVLSPNSGGYIDPSPAASYDGTGFTRVFWVRSDSAGAGVNDQSLLNIYSGGHYMIISLGNQRVNQYSGAAGWWSATPSGSIVTGRWHLVSVFSSGSSRSVSIDGSEWVDDASGTFTTTGTTVRLGTRVDGVGGFNGKIATYWQFPGRVSSGYLRALYEPESRWNIYTPPSRSFWINQVAAGAPSGLRHNRAIVIL